MIQQWMTRVWIHLYWFVLSTKLEFDSMILGKWRSFSDDVKNVHSNFDDPLFPKCCHAAVENLKWIKLDKSYILCESAFNFPPFY